VGSGSRAKSGHPTPPRFFERPRKRSRDPEGRDVPRRRRRRHLRLPRPGYRATRWTCREPGASGLLPYSPSARRDLSRRRGFSETNSAVGTRDRRTLGTFRIFRTDVGDSVMPHSVTTLPCAVRRAHWGKRKKNGQSTPRSAREAHEKAGAGASRTEGSAVVLVHPSLS